MRWTVAAVLCSMCIVLTKHNANAIGEGVVDLNALLGVFGGMANIFTNVNTSDVDIDKLMGKWYQMYKAAINFDVFQTNMYCHVSYFSRNKVMGPQGFSIEEAYHVVGKNGPIETYKRDVTKTGSGEYWMYTEEYFYPRQFYILEAGPTPDGVLNDYAANTTSPDDANVTSSLLSDSKKPTRSQGAYEYLVATDANRLALMVYSRDPAQFYERYDKLLTQALQKGGFGGYVFWNQPVAIYQGSDCYYPDEKEVFARRALKAGGNRQGAAQPSPIFQQPVVGTSDGSPPSAILQQLQQQELLLQQQRQAQIQQQQQQQISALSQLGQLAQLGQVGQLGAVGQQQPALPTLTAAGDGAGLLQVRQLLG